MLKNSFMQNPFPRLLLCSSIIQRKIWINLSKKPKNSNTFSGLTHFIQISLINKSTHHPLSYLLSLLFC